MSCSKYHTKMMQTPVYTQFWKFSLSMRDYRKNHFIDSLCKAQLAIQPWLLYLSWCCLSRERDRWQFTSYRVQLLIFQLRNGCHLFDPCHWCPQCQCHQQHYKLSSELYTSAQVNPAWGQLSSQCSTSQASYLILVRSCSAHQQIVINKAGLALTPLDNDTLDQPCFQL